METVADEIITDKTINPAFQRAVYQTGWVTARAYEIQQELERVSVICKKESEDSFDRKIVIVRRAIQIVYQYYTAG